MTKKFMILAILSVAQGISAMELNEGPEYRRVGARPVSDIAVPRLLQEGYFQGASELINQGVVLSKSTRQLLADPAIVQGVFQAALAEGHINTVNRLAKLRFISADRAQQMFENCVREIITPKAQIKLGTLLSSNVLLSLINLNKPIPSLQGFAPDHALFLLMLLPALENSPQAIRTAFTLIRALLRAGANPNIESEGMPLLNSVIRLASIKFHTDSKSAMYNFYTALLFELIQLPGIDLEMRDNNGMTPLIFASELGLESAVELLLAAGANVNAQDNNQFTALTHALHLANPEPIATMLINHGADLLLTDEDGKNLLEQAREIELPQSLMALIEQKTKEQLAAKK